MQQDRQATPPQRPKIPSGTHNTVSTPAATCEEWLELVKQYQVNARKYADAVARLSSVSGSEFNRAWMRSESSRQHSMELRAALLEHEHKHGCSRHMN
jgi:hypothetical protein